MNKDLYEYEIIENTDNKAFQNIKSCLFHIKDNNFQLKLPDEEEENKLVKNDKINLNIYAKWLIVNGDYIKTDSNQTFKNDSDESINIDQEIENEFKVQSLNEEYNKFYEIITSLILLKNDDCQEDNDEMFDVILTFIKLVLLSNFI